MKGDRIEARLSPDRMSAEIRVTATEPPPTLDEIRSVLVRANVLFGIRDDAILTAIKNPGHWIEIAVGVPVTLPKHGRIDYKFDLSKKPHLAEDAEGNVDLKELGIITNVKAGSVLAALIPSVAGIAGRNVSGDWLAPESAREGELKPGRNVALSPDGRELLSSIDGRVVRDADGRISVENTVSVTGDVGPATGNINFLGTVTVTGNVCSEYRVKAAGKILVHGHVEGAILEAGQDIEVQGGVFGAGKAILQARGDIRIQQAQDARLLCGGAIIAPRGLLRIHAVSAREIRCENGAIVGGESCAPAIFALALGAEAEARTIIEIGISPRARLTCQRLEQEFVSARSDLALARQKLQPLETQHDQGKVLDSEDHALMDRLIEEIQGLERRILLAAADVRALMHDPATNVPGRLEVDSHVHPGVIISTARAEQVIREHRVGLKLTVEDGKAVPTAGGVSGADGKS